MKEHEIGTVLLCSPLTDEFKEYEKFQNVVDRVTCLDITLNKNLNLIGMYSKYRKENYRKFGFEFREKEFVVLEYFYARFKALRRSKLVSKADISR